MAETVSDDVTAAEAQGEAIEDDAEEASDASEQGDDVAEVEETASEAEVGVVKPKKSRKRLVGIVAAIVAVCLVGAYAGATVWENHRLNVVSSESESASTVLAAALKDGEKLAGSVKASQLADSKTLDTLNSAVDSAEAFSQPSADANSWLLWNVWGVKNTLMSANKTSSTLTASLRDAIDNVTTSKDEKTLADAKSALDKAITAAEKVYKDSDGKVSDSKTRDALKKAIDSAKKMRDASDSETQDHKDNKTKVEAAVKKVQESIEAKTKADEAAAAALAQAQAQVTQSEQSYTPTYSNSGGSTYNNTGSNTYNYSNSGSTYGGTTYQNTGGTTNGGTSSNSGGSSSSNNNSSSGGIVGGLQGKVYPEDPDSIPSDGTCPAYVCGT